MVSGFACSRVPGLSATADGNGWRRGGPGNVESHRSDFTGRHKKGTADRHGPLRSRHRAWGLLLRLWRLRDVPGTQTGPGERRAVTSGRENLWRRTAAHFPGARSGRVNRSARQQSPHRIVERLSARRRILDRMNRIDRMAGRPRPASASSCKSCSFCQNSDLSSPFHTVPGALTEHLSERRRRAPESHDWILVPSLHRRRWLSRKELRKGWPPGMPILRPGAGVSGARREARRSLRRGTTGASRTTAIFGSEGGVGIHFPRMIYEGGQPHERE
jgi:hypothetical protein